MTKKLLLQLDNMTKKLQLQLDDTTKKLQLQLDETLVTPTQTNPNNSHTIQHPV
jgi:hypothetical protein